MLDLLSEFGTLSATFNVVDLSLFDIGGTNLWTNPLEEIGDDENQGKDQAMIVQTKEVAQDSAT